MESEYFTKILDKLDTMEGELRNLTKKTDILHAKDLPTRMNTVEQQLSEVKVVQARFFAGITTLAFVIPLALKYIS